MDDGAEGQREGSGVGDIGQGLQVGRVTVPVAMVEERDGPGVEERELKLKVPGLGRRAREREEKLNDLGYRICWSQGRVFSKRMLFLQKGRESPFSSLVSRKTVHGTGHWQSTGLTDRECSGRV